uniref:SFRICE_033683 n=1 Tax=Spodoptera frugiperda TaxID=7108 RepID=A0A2H1W004_SPOFR
MQVYIVRASLVEWSQMCSQAMGLGFDCQVGQSRNLGLCLVYGNRLSLCYMRLTTQMLKDRCTSF